jgi:hemoglobin
MPAPSSPPPTLYEWAGGMPALQRLTAHFYERVRVDPVLATVFAQLPGDHPSHVAQFIAEVLGGPSTYSATRGGHPHMITQHLIGISRRSSGAAGSSWLLASADATGLPDDPEFRSALVAYLEWGSRLAVLNSQPGVEVVVSAPMPKWDWGVPGGPYRG